MLINGGHVTTSDYLTAVNNRAHNVSDGAFQPGMVMDLAFWDSSGARYLMKDLQGTHRTPVSGNFKTLLDIHTAALATTPPAIWIIATSNPRGPLTVTGTGSAQIQAAALASVLAGGVDICVVSDGLFITP
jgi:hypothetical protein